MTREEATKTLTELWGVDYRYCLGTMGVEAVDMAIEALKEPEQKAGSWITPSRNPEIVNKELFCDCSVCGFTTMDETNFCPHCGAKMGEEK